MKKILSITLLLSLTIFAIAQTDPVLVNIGGVDIQKSEFQRIYDKNQSQSASQQKESVENYFDLFLNFKLKVREALDNKLDTLPSFVRELAGYRVQLARPYLTDSKVNSKLVLEAFERMQKEINVSHLLIKVDFDSIVPADTAFAYKKIGECQKRLQNGESLQKVSAELIKSLEGKPQFKVYQEDLGYFSTLQMVYPFETAAYETEIGKISKIVKTRFGYHVLKVNGVREARPEIRAAHIMIKSNDNSSDEEKALAITKINEIYTKLQAGENFTELAKKFSDDRNSGKLGGVLPWYRSGDLETTFADVAYGLEKETYSKPIKTPYGWHIIKKIDVKEIPSFKEVEKELLNKISKDSRAEISKTTLLAKLKKENNLKQNLASTKELYNLVNKKEGGLVKNIDAAKYNKVLFSFEYKNVKKDYKQSNFLNAIAFKNIAPKKDATTLINELLTDYIDEQTLKFEEENLENKYPKFKSDLNEYKEGILLFDLMDQKVWSKAMKDTAGLNEFYNNNSNNYLWDKRVVATTYTCANAGISAKTRDLVAKKIAGKITKEKLLSKINKKSSLNLSAETKTYLKYEDDNVDAIEWFEGMMGKNVELDGGSVLFVSIDKVIPPTPKTLKEARGLVVTDYQNYLEQEWLKDLKNKYPVKVNKEVLKTIQ